MKLTTLGIRVGAILLAISSTASAASQASWEADRVLISGQCTTDFVAVLGSFGLDLAECIAGSYEYLAPLGSLSPGDEVVVFVDDLQEIVTVPAAPQPTPAPALGTSALSLSFLLLVVGAISLVLPRAKPPRAVG